MEWVIEHGMIKFVITFEFPWVIPILNWKIELLRTVFYIKLIRGFTNQWFGFEKEKAKFEGYNVSSEYLDTYLILLLILETS